jgi:hypothetical protein
MPTQAPGSAPTPSPEQTRDSGSASWSAGEGAGSRRQAGGVRGATWGVRHARQEPPRLQTRPARLRPDCGAGTVAAMGRFSLPREPLTHRLRPGTRRNSGSPRASTPRLRGLSVPLVTSVDRASRARLLNDRPPCPGFQARSALCERASMAYMAPEPACRPGSASRVPPSPASRPSPRAGSPFVQATLQRAPTGGMRTPDDEPHAQRNGRTTCHRSGRGNPRLIHDVQSHIGPAGGGELSEARRLTMQDMNKMGTRQLASELRRSICGRRAMNEEPLRRRRTMRRRLPSHEVRSGNVFAECPPAGRRASPAEGRARQSHRRHPEGEAVTRRRCGASCAGVQPPLPPVPSVVHPRGRLTYQHGWPLSWRTEKTSCVIAANSGCRSFWRL